MLEIIKYIYDSPKNIIITIILMSFISMLIIEPICEAVKYGKKRTTRKSYKRKKKKK